MGVDDQVTEGDRVASRWFLDGNYHGRPVTLRVITISCFSARTAGILEDRRRQLDDQPRSPCRAAPLCRPRPRRVFYPQKQAAQRAHSTEGDAESTARPIGHPGLDCDAFHGNMPVALMRRARLDGGDCARAGDLQRLDGAHGAAEDECALQQGQHRERQLARLSRWMPAATKYSVAPEIQLSKTSAVASRSGSLVLATSRATVAIGQASA